LQHTIVKNLYHRYGGKKFLYKPVYTHRILEVCSSSQSSTGQAWMARLFSTLQLSDRYKHWFPSEYNQSWQQVVQSFGPQILTNMNTQFIIFF
jgi:hypothetical protein